MRPLPVFVLVVYSLVALNLTGFPWYAQSGNQWGGNEFGWPFTYASAPWTDSQSEEAVDYRLHRHRMAEFTGFIAPVLGPWNADTGDFHAPKLLANLVICVVIAFAAAFVTWQLSMNRDGQPFQFSIASLLLMAVIVATLTGGLGSRYTYYYFILYRGWINLCILVFCAIVASLSVFMAVRQIRQSLSRRSQN